MKRCDLDFEALLDYHEEQFDATKTEHMHRHIETGCADCRRQLTWIQKFLPALHVVAATELPIVPAAAMERAYNIARERQPKASPSLLTRMAQLIFDSRQTQPAFGARSAEVSEVQLVYTTEFHDVDLWQERQSANVWYVIGQVLPRSGGEPIIPKQVLLVGGDGRRLNASTVTNEFMVRDVSPGAYEVRLRLIDQEIVLSDVAVGIARQ
jgi:hypothetical protein